MFVPLLGREMGVEEILVPQAPSVFSAWGMLMADVVYDFAQTEIDVLSDIEFEDLEAAFQSLQSEAAETLADEGFEEERQRLERYVEMRYFGQEHTVEVPADGIKSTDELADRFEDLHESRYGHTMDDPAQSVHLRVRAVGENDKPSLEGEESSAAGSLEPHETTEAYCFAEEDIVPFEVYQRDKIAPGDVIDGPAIVREPTTTIVFHSDQEAEADEYGHLFIRSEAQ